jgi:hypothetical protein
MRASLLRRWLAAGIALTALAGAGYPVAAQAADPFVLFLLRMLRDQVISSAIESGAVLARPAPARGHSDMALAAPRPAAEGERLRRLINESFIHLAQTQRDDLHASLVEMLDDPKNASQRSAIIAEFSARAGAVRDAHRQLTGMSETEMRRIAAEAGHEFAKLPAEQRQQLMEALRQGIPGLPRTLGELMLAQFREAPAAN